MNQLMTEREKADISMKAIALEKEGKKEEAMELEKSIPMLPFMAEFWKKHGHLDHFIKEGWNMAEVEAAFGPDWLTQ